MYMDNINYTCLTQSVLRQMGIEVIVLKSMVIIIHWARKRTGIILCHAPTHKNKMTKL